MVHTGCEYYRFATAMTAAHLLLELIAVLAMRF